MWKWNLAFQCVVNIGVRGSESVRTRVVEADMVPVIATILDNYIKVTDKYREDKDAEARRANPRAATTKTSRAPKENSARSGFQDRGANSSDHRSIRRQAPPSIEIPRPFPQPAQQPQTGDGIMELTAPQLSLTSPQDRTSSPRSHHHHHRSHHHHHHRSQDSRTLSNRHSLNSTVTLPSMDTTDGFGLRPVRDADRLPSMIPALQNGITSQPESPTTPNAPVTSSIVTSRGTRRRPSIHQQQSNSGDSDDGGTELAPDHVPSDVVAGGEPMVDIQTTVEIDGRTDQEAILDAVPNPLDLAVPTGSDGPEVETFNITHRTTVDGSIINANITPTVENNTTIGLRPPPPPLHPIIVPAPSNSPNHHGRYLLDRSAPPGVLAATPRDEDVLMSLQLLAYVSKYCNLRTYFQKSHLVPKLKIGPHLRMLDDSPASSEISFPEESNEEEYLLPDDYNIFPLVEKFTVRHHSQDMQYWAGVVMRNLCRKDDSRGGIRQCAYYECGKWEEWTRQFAKCRRCRRTKYCSKECQKNAWVFHRHWCQVANP